MTNGEHPRILYAPADARSLDFDVRGNHAGGYPVKGGYGGDFAER